MCDLHANCVDDFPLSPNNSNNNNKIAILFCFLFRELTNKQTYNALVDKLMNEKLVLNGISESADDSAVTNMEGVLQTVLIVVSVVLGTLVVVLFAAFFIRTRR
jgi:hypothetical protein